MLLSYESHLNFKTNAIDIKGITRNTCQMDQAVNQNLFKTIKPVSEF